MSEFVWKTFTEIRGMESGSYEVHFKTRSATYRMYHEPDCCESVYLDDVCGDPSGLIGTPILGAYYGDSSGVKAKSESDESFTWTFYRFATIKGTVTLKWYGTSNGYYSECVNIERL